MNYIQILDGYKKSSLLIAAAELNLFAKIGKAGVSLSTLSQGFHEPSLLRLLSALASMDLLVINAEVVSLTEQGLKLLNNDSFLPLAKITSTQYLKAWSELSHTIKTGEPGLSKVLGDFAWEHRSEDVISGNEFVDFMGSVEKSLAPKLVNHYGFGRFDTIANLGGGAGYLILEILKRHSHVNGIIQDLPHVTEHSRKLFQEHELLDRVEIIGKSFFDSVPAADLYILQSILHDWDDKLCLQLLKNIKNQAKPAAKLLLIDNLVKDPIKDLHMLLVSNGKERNTEEFTELFRQVGFSQMSIVGKRAIEVDI